MVDDRIRKLREELSAANSKYNMLQKKHAELKKSMSLATRRIETQKNIIEELEQKLSDKK